MIYYNTSGCVVAAKEKVVFVYNIHNKILVLSSLYYITLYYIIYHFLFLNRGAEFQSRVVGAVSRAPEDNEMILSENII